MRSLIERLVCEDVDLGGGVNFGKSPCLETAFEAVKVGSGLEEFREDDVNEFVSVDDTERLAGGEPRDGVYH